MLINTKILVFFLIFIYSKTILASSSASFLISKNAFNNYDFSQVLHEFNSNKSDYYKIDYLDELISAVVTQDVILADKISEKILLTDPNNQEAKLLIMVRAFNLKNKQLKEYRFDKKNKKNDLFEFIFFSNDKIKSKIEISNAFLEIVRSSYSQQSSKYSTNYNFLLFYTSLSILINEKNYEAIFIKGQLLQMINDYYFAESTFLSIPKESNYFEEAQRNIL